MKTSLFRARPHLWYQLYWVVYLIWFFWLDLTVTDPKYIIHSPLDDFIPFNEWFIFPYGSWFFLLAGVTALENQCRHLIIVSNEVFEGGTNYDPSTVRYLDILGKINREIAKMADAAAEITAGCWIWHKQGGKIQ